MADGQGVCLGSAKRHLTNDEPIIIKRQRIDSGSQFASYANPFDRLPIEIHQKIALYILDDRDLFHYRSTCRSTAAAVESDGLSFWRRRFLATFDPPCWMKHAMNVQFRDIYRQRLRAMRHMSRTDFQLGHSTREIACLETFRDILIDALATLEVSHRPSYNIDMVRRLAIETNVLEVLGRSTSRIPPKRHRGRTPVPTEPSALLQAFQVLLAPDVLSFHAHIQNAVNDFPTSQQYAYGTASQYSIFGGRDGQEIDMTFVARNLHFWKYHMTQKDEALYPAFAALEDHERPRYPLTTDRSPSKSTQLGGIQWKGSYAYVSPADLWKIRHGIGHEDPIQDIFNGEMELGAFQDLRLISHESLNEDAAPIFWPARFEQSLRSRPLASTTPPVPAPQSRVRTRHQRKAGRARSRSIGNVYFHDDDDAKDDPPQQHRSSPEEAPVSVHFDGYGCDSCEDFRATGWLNTLPPQCGVPGWQRMVMMKYFEEDEDGSIDEAALWAYEGVVLPGAQIILGRWWSPNDPSEDEMYSGPFILWCIDGAAAVDEA